MVSTRRRRDRLIAAGIAVVVLALAAWVYLNSDQRHLTRTEAETAEYPVEMTRAPQSLTAAWQMTAPGQFTPVVSPYGTVVTADDHAVVGYDSTDGERRWEYARSNIPLCAFGSGDTGPGKLDQSNAVRGIFTAYSKSNRCSEITTLNPQTGDRMKQRTVEDELDSEVAFGGPYAAFIGPTLIELWRFDLVRTIQYGDQPTPTKANSKHLGCQFQDIGLADKQFATIEKCDANPDTRQLVVNWADPDSAPPADDKGWDNFKFEARGTVDLETTDARILGVTAEDIAVLAGGPSPEIVVYSMVEPEPETPETTDAGSGAGTATSTSSTSEAPEPDTILTEISRTAVDVDDSAIQAMTTKVTPSVIDGDDRYTTIGDSLVAVRGSDLAESWTLRGVLGKVAVVGSDLLVPIEAGLAVVDASTGDIKRTIELDRGSYAGPVDVHTSGSMVIELRGSDVVAYQADSSAIAVEPSESSESSESTESTEATEFTETATISGTADPDPDPSGRAPVLSSSAATRTP